MADNELIKQNYKDIANAIRAKTGENGTMTATEMPAKISTLTKPAGEIEISEPFTKVDVSDKQFAYTNNDNVFCLPDVRRTGGSYCYLDVKSIYDNSNEPLYCNEPLNIDREYDPTDPELSNPYRFSSNGTISYYVSYDTIRPKWQNNCLIDNRRALDDKNLALVLNCIYNDRLAPADINIELDISLTFRLHHENMTFEEAIAAFGDYIDIIDLHGTYIKKNVPISDIVTQWIDNDSSGSTSINSDEYSY